MPADWPGNAQNASACRGKRLDRSLKTLKTRTPRGGGVFCPGGSNPFPRQAGEKGNHKRTNSDRTFCFLRACRWKSSVGVLAIAFSLSLSRKGLFQSSPRKPWRSRWEYSRLPFDPCLSRKRQFREAKTAVCVAFSLCLPRKRHFKASEAFKSQLREAQKAG